MDHFENALQDEAMGINYTMILPVELPPWWQYDQTLIDGRWSLIINTSIYGCNTMCTAKNMSTYGWSTTCTCDDPLSEDMIPKGKDTWLQLQHSNFTCWHFKECIQEIMTSIRHVLTMRITWTMKTTSRIWTSTQIGQSGSLQQNSLDNTQKFFDK